ncbi:hypothetical protein GCM10027040_03890 [Halomonas shantousis]
MVTEPQRLQYLEAMGLTAWSSRYRLPNAAPTPSCEWPQADAPPVEPPGARLHALLDAAGKTEAPAEPPAAPRPSLARARALLQDEDAGQEAPASVARGEHAEPRHPPAPEPAPEVTAEPLRFVLQIGVLQQRWLVLVPEQTEMGGTEQQLLGNLLRAAGIALEDEPAFETFRWPLMAGMSAISDPLEEARDGMRAFVMGQARRGWRPERLLIFGEEKTLLSVLQVEKARCLTLDLPCWQLPSLHTLANSADAKRGLWPELARWQAAWADTSWSDASEPSGAH